MIICFSGTGNSLKVAERLAASLGDEIAKVDAALAAALPAMPRCGRCDLTVWVFPVYGWGMPEIISEVIAKADFRTAGLDAMPHWMVATCGDDIGLTHRLWRKALGRRGLRCAGAFSVTMPNTYVFLPGFDFDPPEVAQRKLEAMPARVDAIAAAMGAPGEVVADDVTEGAMPWVKSAVLRPLFNRTLTSPRGFRVDPDRCVGCGACARSCPLDNVTMVDRRPHWGPDCTFCTACYFRCPERAVSYHVGWTCFN